MSSPRYTNDVKMSVHSTEELVKAIKQRIEDYLAPHISESPMLSMWRNPSRGELLAKENLAILAILENQYGTAIPRDEIILKFRYPGERFAQVLTECFERFPNAGKTKNDSTVLSEVVDHSKKASL